MKTALEIPPNLPALQRANRCSNSHHSNTEANKMKVQKEMYVHWDRKYDGSDDWSPLGAT